MMNSARVKSLIAGACGVLLAMGGASPALASDGFDVWGGSGNGDTWVEMDSILVCKHRAKICVNGPLNSGNLKNSQNVYLSGNQSNSGSPTNINGASEADNTGKGNENDSENNTQKVR
ncbi:hypothetical protein B1H19_26530 [Streptomyces gilvosporeus]|uniref:Secreted protein n=2 Tax=Streptomyces gilvosporeus TaxID=553510 RepID=A0A1V0TWP8_9ACTN|nr:hypothetical protein B1H19_26530 [Streptomyces gilvosporeus]